LPVANKHLPQSCRFSFFPLAGPALEITLTHIALSLSSLQAASSPPRLLPPSPL
jgi:hypothetical protein